MINTVYLDYLGTIAFAFSGSMVAIRKKMDIFGVVVLALITATGGGCLRDIFTGTTPPLIFGHPEIILLALSTSLITFWMLYRNKKLPEKGKPLYQTALFISDTVGLASFTIGGLYRVVELGYQNNFILSLFLITVTATGGGVIRDICAQKTPDIFVKQVYASATLLGSFIGLFLLQTEQYDMAYIVCFVVVVIIRIVASRLSLDLPHID